MAEKDDEDERLRSVALQNAQSILQARRRAEEALRKQAEWLRITLASIGDAVISTDAEGRVTFMNGVAEGLTGWPQAEATGRLLTEIFHIVNERTREPVENPVIRALREGTVVGLANHTVLIARDGTERPIDDSAAPIRDEGGTSLGVVLVFRDVSERKRAEEAQAFLAAIVESSQDAIVSKSLEGVIRTWNAGAERLFGYTAQEAVGRPITLIIPRERHDEEHEILARIRSGERVEHFDTVRVTKQGRRIDISLTVSPVRDAAGHIIGASKVVRDITERKRAEQALREAHDLLERRVAERTADWAKLNETLRTEIAGHLQTEAARSAAVQQLINAREAEGHRIARELHDQMGQHLTALGLGLKVLRDGTPQSSPARELLRQLQELADVIGKEVHNLALELRPTALDDFGLHTALATYVEKWSARSGVGVDLHSTGLEEKRLPSPIETALYRVVQEGLTNVLKHAQARRVSLILQRSPDQVLAILEDDGRGFDADAALSTRGPRGRLGLLGMRERVALVGGTLTIESTPGRGTTIFVRIPLPGNWEEDNDGETARLPGR